MAKYEIIVKLKPGTITVMAISLRLYGMMLRWSLQIMIVSAKLDP